LVPAGETAGGRQLIEATFGLETFVLGAGILAAESGPGAGGGGLIGGTE